MKISEDRVNVTDEGYLLEADQLDRLSPDDVYFRTERILMNIKDPDVEPGSPQYEWIGNYVNEAENALYGADFADPETGYAKYLNVDTYVDWYVISEITKTNDASLYTSCYMNIAPGGKLNMGGRSGISTSAWAIRSGTVRTGAAPKGTGTANRRGSSGCCRIRPSCGKSRNASAISSPTSPSSWRRWTARPPMPRLRSSRITGCGIT